MEGIAMGVITTVSVLLAFGISVIADRDRVYMTRSPDSVPMPFRDQTTLICEMNLKPDNFTWKHYRIADPSNANTAINFGNASYEIVPADKYRNDRKTSALQISLDSEDKTGDYQCLAQYGASVVASVPGRITISTVQDFPAQSDTVTTVSAGNTIIWWCDLPYSNPPAYVDYYKGGNFVKPKHNIQKVSSLIIPNVSEHDSGIYKCKVNILGENRESRAALSLKVVNSNSFREAPRFLRPPKKIYVAVKDDTVFLECPVVGSPVPTVKWSKRNGRLPQSRSEEIYNGLKIVNVTSSDEGVYICYFSNMVGSLHYEITLSYNEPPTILQGPENRDVREGEDLDLECNVRGTPEPIVSWISNGNSVLNDSSIEAVGNRIYFRPVEKRHAGILQCFASNKFKTVYSSANIKVIPKQIASTDSDILSTPASNISKRKKHKIRKNKHGKDETSQMMIPPSKPTISRLNDESVVVRWSVPPNKGLPISFFKVQYRELGPANHNESYPRGKGSRWRTANEDISPHIFSYEVRDLKPDYYYKFRIAAVYSNNDNKISQHSSRFLLERQDFYIRNPLPVPRLTHTEAINSTAIQIFWEHTPVAGIKLDGFYVNYILASSAGDFTKATVEGEDKRSYIINHLQPDTMYDIKLQSFTTNSASDFSAILKQKTSRDLSVVTTTVAPKSGPKQESKTTNENLHIYIASAAIVIAVVCIVIALLVVCRKWKKKKNDKRDGDRDKPAVEDGGHHIQADANDYVVSPKTLSRANGCITPNRMNITANPLADADNKNQNMIEMSCLSSQNNNCSQPSASTQESLPADSLKKNKNRDKSKRNKNSDSAPSENYV